MPKCPLCPHKGRTSYTLFSHIYLAHKKSEIIQKIMEKLETNQPFIECPVPGCKARMNPKGLKTHLRYSHFKADVVEALLNLLEEK